MTNMSPIDWAIRPLKLYADFTGRAPRAEYWWYTLITGVIGWIFGYVDEAIAAPGIGQYGYLSLTLMLALFIPGLAVTVRRLHDINRTGWWIVLHFGLYGMIALLGVEMVAPGSIEQLNPIMMLSVVLAAAVAAIVLLVFMVTRGNEGSNDYGPDPYGPGSLEEVFA